MEALARAGHPTITLAVHGASDLGRIFFFSEFAVAVAGWVLGINTSREPAAFISSRTMASTLRITFKPMGSQVYRPEASLRIMPARSISWWLITTASEGVSFCVASKY